MQRRMQNWRPSAWAVRCLIVISAAAITQAAHADRLRELQTQAAADGKADWGHWGTDPDVYSQYAWHSNRLVPIYTFGIRLDDYRGAQSIYRDAKRLTQLYGKLPEGTHNVEAEYFDQTDVYRLQRQALAQGKKYIILMIFDGLDWPITRAAATHYLGEVGYQEGRGRGLLFQDYRGAVTDFGYLVTSPRSQSAKTDVDGQVVVEQDVGAPGGYDAAFGGPTPWTKNVDGNYLIGKRAERTHAVTDSAAAGTAMMSGVKTYGGAINVDAEGLHVEPISHELQRRGFAIGVVSNVPVSHATPASAYAQNVSRKDPQDLARDLLGQRSVSHRLKPLAGVDVLLGCGWGQNAAEDALQGENYEPGNPNIAASTLRDIDVANGGRYRVVQRQPGVDGREALLAAAREAADADQRLFGMFGTRLGNLPYRTADGNHDRVVYPQEVQEKFSDALAFHNPPREYTEAELKENPSLATMTYAALEVLSTSDRGFWLMVEAGDVDWAQHGNNIDNAVGAIRSGDGAFRTITRWLEQHDAWKDAAVIVTADHGHLFELRKPEALIETEEPTVRPSAQ